MRVWIIVYNTMIHMMCSEPRSLIMRIQVCDYCQDSLNGMNDDGKNNGSVNVIYSLGILSCKKHTGWAKRDCKAFLGKRGRFRMEDAENVPAINRLLSVLKEREEGFPVIRSSGDIDHGWEVSTGGINQPNHICKNGESDWMIRVITVDKARDIHKAVSLNDYLRNDMLSHFPEGFKNIVEEAIAALNAGLYNEEMREWNELSNNPDNGYLPDIEGIKQVINQSGDVGRVLYLPSDE